MSTQDNAVDLDTDDGYRGIATLEFDSFAIEVDVLIHDHFQPIDGIYRWYGRVSADPHLSRHLAGNKAVATVRTPTGSARATVGEPDVWDRYRIIGRNHPPYHLPDPTVP